MRWEGRRQSSNVEDRRGKGMRRGAAVGGGGIVMALVAIFLLGQDPGQVMQQMQQQQAQAQRQAQTQQAGEYRGSAQEEKLKAFVSTVLAETEDTWNVVFKQAGYKYQPTKLVLYTDQTSTACGMGSASAGPFYCPGDNNVYLDLSFVQQLQKMGATGDFALAYVLAHEVGHHIQALTGTAAKVQQFRQRASKAQGNAMQVKMELQADCYAGVWANHTQARTQLLERGDIEEALQAAASVGDDTIMRNAGRRVVKEAFTHGSSQERMQWFARGMDVGQLSACETGI